MGTLNLGNSVTLSGGGILELGSGVELNTTAFSNPNLPAWFASNTGANSNIAGGSKIPFTLDGDNIINSVRRGTSYSNVNSRWTAPVAGLYYVGCTIFFQSVTDTHAQIVPRKNGSQLNTSDGSNTGDTIFFMSRPGNPDSANPLSMTMSGSIIMDLAVDDYVEVYLRSGNDTTQIYLGHSCFFGYLIG